MNRARGFSLIELVVTIIIAGILAALITPRLLRTEIDASWFSEQAKAAVRYAQRQAVAQRRAVYVVVQAAGIDLCYSADCTSLPRLTKITDGTQYSLAAPAGVAISPATTFWFNGLGQPSTGTDVLLDIGGTVITIAKETGYVY
jgi:MSHA pilin protein MshC